MDKDFRGGSPINKIIEWSRLALNFEELLHKNEISLPKH